MTDPDATTDGLPQPCCFETEAVHAGIERGSGLGLGFPIFQLAAFQFASQQEAAEEFASNRGHSYSRLQNPTARALEARLAALEGASHAVALASGQAASFTAMFSVCRAGDHIVATRSLFGGSAGLLQNVLPLMGVQSTLVENDPRAVHAAMRENTRLVWAETIGNPAGDVADIAGLAEAAHAGGALLGIDNTFGGVGYLCRPLEQGADIVAHSLTKWAAGHGQVLGGAVLTGEGHDLSRNPIFTDGQPSLLELRGGPQALAWRQRWLGAHTLGMTLGPQAAFQIGLGLESLALRLQRECDSALALARQLRQHPAVRCVHYAGLPESPWHGLAQRYLPRGAGGVLSFEVDDVARVFSRLKLIRIAANLGDSRTLVIHPWTTTHGRLAEGARRAAGVTPGLIRMSVGLEAPEDLMRDLNQALG